MEIMELWCVHARPCGVCVCVLGPCSALCGEGISEFVWCVNCVVMVL